jgi:hypothetical protein
MTELISLISQNLILYSFIAVSTFCVLKSIQSQQRFDLIRFFSINLSCLIIAVLWPIYWAFRILKFISGKLS